MKRHQSLFVVPLLGLGIAFGLTDLGGPLSRALGTDAIASDAPTTVLIVQHAERNDFTPTDPDPELTPDGKERAEELARFLGDAGIAAIFSPKARRMVQTVEPLQQVLKLPELNNYEPGAFDPLLREIRDRYKGKVVLVVGPGSHMGGGGIHDVIKGLGCAGPESEFKDAYDNLTVVTVYDPIKATAVRFRYGKPVKP